MDQPDSTTDGTMRLARYLAHSGVASRRAAEELIRAGRVQVDGEVVTDPATAVGRGQEVQFDGRAISPEEREEIRKDQADCMGCLSHCGFSSWKDHDDYTTGRLADPRSFCIQKTLQAIAHGGDIDKNLMFAGHAAYRFKQDPFYSNNFTPTVKQLVDRILTGD
jgi:ribosomal protein S4